VLVFEHDFALEDNIGCHTCSLEAFTRVDNRTEEPIHLPNRLAPVISITTLYLSRPEASIQGAMKYTLRSSGGNVLLPFKVSVSGTVLKHLSKDLQLPLLPNPTID
jgi:hypothetical protein